MPLLKIWLGLSILMGAVVVCQNQQLSRLLLTGFALVPLADELLNGPFGDSIFGLAGQNILSPELILASLGTILVLSNLQGQSEATTTAVTTTTTAAPVCDGDYTRNPTTNICYRVSPSAYAAVADAFAFCTNDGATPLNVDSATVSSFSQTVMTTESMPAGWIDGIRESSSSAVWRDSSGNEITYFDWASGQPDSFCCYRAQLASGQMLAGPGGGTALKIICEKLPRVP